MTRAVNEDIEEPQARRAGWSHDWQPRWSHEPGREPLRPVPYSWQATTKTVLVLWASDRARTGKYLACAGHLLRRGKPQVPGHPGASATSSRARRIEQRTGRVGQKLRRRRNGVASTAVRAARPRVRSVEMCQRPLEISQRRSPESARSWPWQLPGGGHRPPPWHALSDVCTRFPRAATRDRADHASVTASSRPAVARAIGWRAETQQHARFATVVDADAQRGVGVGEPERHRFDAGPSIAAEDYRGCYAGRQGSCCEKLTSAQTGLRRGRLGAILHGRQQRCTKSCRASRGEHCGTGPDRARSPE